MASKVHRLARLAVMAVALVSVQIATAQESVGDLTQVQARTILARAKNALAAEEAKMAERTANETDGSVTAAPARELLPVVTRVSGRTTDPTAYLLFQDGTTVPVKAGQVVRSKLVVKSVSAERVIVAQAGVKHSLGFSVIPPRPASSKATLPVNPQSGGAY